MCAGMLYQSIHAPTNVLQLNYAQINIFIYDFTFVEYERFYNKFIVGL